jgi:two-component system, chemotaxis family, chemotaxis protein CheY
MNDPAYVVLLVDPDSSERARLVAQLKPSGCRILEAEDGTSAMRIVGQTRVSIMITELYLSTGDHPCVIDALREDPTHGETRVVAHTHRSTTPDRDWAMRAGADAYLIKPTRAQRVRYVVNRLLTERSSNGAPSRDTSASMLRRDSLDTALDEIEGGKLADTSTIVFDRKWWEQLSTSQRKAYRMRAKSARVNLRSDSMLGGHFVEIRGLSRAGVGLSTERPESPYRR